ncbi:Asp23/Gls24 family envelope stress response protein [Streptomyces canus]|uniref:Asp23/Gls24 family envelope stress response protein n=1 Tax=Streptomyces canus TaxID=58343 RepID=UPI0022509A72|nr:Asp23/Gls24 family envelope stress response protein [Streptomyces canus]MCX4858693.1 Asp23/Gls24 family envelope stress response protein [Streptomyces canus]WSW36015.1 Asp23/Gls24 family envelope stress response protein [Streptomyces canus]
MTAHTDPPNRASVHGDDDEVLPCGRLLSRTWEDWEQRPDDAHLRSCPYCRDAVRELDRMESAVRDLRTEAVDGSLYDAEPLTRRIMDVVRMELRPGRPLPLGEPAEDLWIMEAVAARTLRAAAETVAGVRAGSCRLLDAGADDAGADGVVEGVGVRLDIHAPAGAPLPELAAQVRERVWEAADRELGLVVAMVDIRVTDLVPAGTEHGQEGRTR